MVYADYEYYTNEYLLGKKTVIDTAAFPYYARQASIEIDAATFGKAGKSFENDMSEAKEGAVLDCCCCELAELMYTYDNSKQNSGITSEKVGGYSVSYGSQSATDIAVKQNIIIRKWLTDTGLLYLGVT